MLRFKLSCHFNVAKKKCLFFGCQHKHGLTLLVYVRSNLVITKLKWEPKSLRYIHCFLISIIGIYCNMCSMGYSIVNTEIRGLCGPRNRYMATHAMKFE